MNLVAGLMILTASAGVPAQPPVDISPMAEVTPPAETIQPIVSVEDQINHVSTQIATIAVETYENGTGGYYVDNTKRDIYVDTPPLYPMIFNTKQQKKEGGQSVSLEYKYSAIVPIEMRGIPTNQAPPEVTIGTRGRFPGGNIRTYESYTLIRQEDTVVIIIGDHNSPEEPRGIEGMYTKEFQNTLIRMQQLTCGFLSESFITPGQVPENYDSTTNSCKSN